jgi:hypothetical protein
LDVLNLVNDDITDFGPETLTPVFGQGAFVFIDFAETQFIQSPATSNTSGIGAHGPSGTGPGESAEWGVLSGFDVTGTTFCIASPVQLCNQANFLHGATVTSTQPSGT